MAQEADYANMITNRTGWDSNAYWASVGEGAGAGALIGGTVGTVAPVALEAASTTLAGASAATGSTTLASAATTTYAAAGTMASADFVALKMVSDKFSILRQINLAPSSPAPSMPSSGSSTALTNYWPPNRGFYGDTKRTHLMPGEIVDRYGYEGGTFVSPKGVPFEERALPPENLAKPYHTYEVMKPIEAVSGVTAPAFGQIGFGKAYELPRSVSILLRKGFLREIDP